MYAGHRSTSGPAPSQTYLATLHHPISAVRYWGGQRALDCVLSPLRSGQPASVLSSRLVVFSPLFPSVTHPSEMVLLVSTYIWSHKLARPRRSLIAQPRSRCAMPCNISLLAPSGRLTGCGTDAARDQPRVECSVGSQPPAGDRQHGWRKNNSRVLLEPVWKGKESENDE